MEKTTVISSYVLAVHRFFFLSAINQCFDNKVVTFTESIVKKSCCNHCLLVSIKLYLYLYRIVL